MKLLKRVQEFAAFTKNEQKVFLFLSIVFLAGVSIKAYKAFVVKDPITPFNYAAQDSEFAERSKKLTQVPPERSTAPAGTTGKAQHLHAKININAAAARDFIMLPGIGQGLADQIVRYRSDHGAFGSLEDLKNIKGIGSKKFEKLRPYITLQ